MRTTTVVRSYPLEMRGVPSPCIVGQLVHPPSFHACKPDELTPCFIMQSSLLPQMQRVWHDCDMSNRAVACSIHDNTVQILHLFREGCHDST